MRESDEPQEQTIIASKTYKYNKTINDLVVIIGISSKSVL